VANDLLRQLNREGLSDTRSSLTGGASGSPPITKNATGYGHTYVSARRNFAVIPAAAEWDDDGARAMRLLDATTGEKVHDISFWQPGLRVLDVSEDGRLVFLTTGDRRAADGNSLVVGFESNRVVATLPANIISDGGLYMNGQRAWTRAGRGTWGRSLEYPVTIWDVEKQQKIIGDRRRDFERPPRPQRHG
jgi:hypothetical protein